jgi:hypothetical protein
VLDAKGGRRNLAAGMGFGRRLEDVEEMWNEYLKGLMVSNCDTAILFDSNYDFGAPTNEMAGAVRGGCRAEGGQGIKFKESCLFILCSSPRPHKPPSLCMMTSSDLFDGLLGLEEQFYKEGFEAGVADSAYAGMIEGKVFGIEKGYERALELGRLHGRAIIWRQRLTDNAQKSDVAGSTGAEGGNVDAPIRLADQTLPRLPDNARLRKHIENLLSLTDPKTLPKDNSDESVSEVDDRISKAKARAKMISTMVGEPLDPGQAAPSGIEDSAGLSART